MSRDKISEVVLPRRVRPQPTPEINGGGDCGACVFAGLFDISIECAYDQFHEERTTISHGEMGRMLRVAEMREIADRFIDQPAHFRPRWSSNGLACFGEAAFLSAKAWHHYVQAMIDAGYYGLAQIDIDRKGLDGKGSNHWVLICGARIGEKWVTREGGQRCGEFINEVLVSCSARRTGGAVEWVDAGDFLKYRGGYDLLFARPTTP